MASKVEIAKAVLVITSDDATGYTIVKTFGIVAGGGSGAGKSATSKTAEAWAEALATLRENAYDLGANAVIGIRQSAYGASAGGMFGDAVGVLLSGTAVELGPRKV